MIREHFDTIEAFIAQARKSQYWESGRAIVSTANGRTGTKTREEAATLAIMGWKEGSDKARELRNRIIERIPLCSIARPQLTYDVVGGAVDIGRAMAGDPECMMEFPNMLEDPHRGKHGSIVRMIFAGGVPQDVEASEMILRGATFAALIDLLESAGRSVELTWSKANERGSKTSEATVTIKKAGETLDLDRVVFALANPAMPRQLGYAWQESRGIDYGGTYGESRSSFEAGQYDISVGPEDTLWQTPDQCTAHLIQQLEKQGVTLL